MEKSDKIKLRLLEVAKNKGISYEKFFKDFSTSYDNFKGKSLKSSLRSAVLVDFSHKHPDVNLHWLITGEKKETKEIPQNIAMERPSNYGNSYRDKYFEVLEENRVLSKKVISLLESNNNLKKDTGIVYK